jgi:ABC-type transport system substrate-binding protein
LNHLNSFTNSPEPSWARYNNPEYEKLVMKVKTTQIGKERTAFAEEANRLIVEKDMVVVPLLVRKQVFAIAKNVKNFKVSPYLVIQLGQLTK